MVFGHSVKCHAPPEISVNLNVPLIPPSVGGIAPALLLEQLKHGAKQIMTVPALFAPKNAATQSAEKTVSIGQVFVRLNDTPRCPFEMQPGEIT